MRKVGLSLALARAKFNGGANRTVVGALGPVTEFGVDGQELYANLSGKVFFFFRNPPWLR